MSFLEELRDFLRHPVIFPAETIREYRRHFLACLERMEREGTDAQALAHAQYTLGSDLEWFVSRVSRALLTQGIRGAEVPGLVMKAISFALQIDEPASSITRTLVVREVTTQVMKSDPSRPAFFPIQEDRWRDVAAYASEIRAIRAQNGHAELTPIGRAFLDLTGLDAVRWLLHVEATLSTGVEDVWRVDRGTLQLFAKVPEWTWPSQLQEYEESPELSWSTMRRLSALGIIKIFDDGLENGYRVFTHARPIVQEFARGTDSPMAVLVAALLQDDAHGRLPEGRAPSSATATATVRQARLVVHEIRNALIPVKVALDGIYRAARGAGIESSVTSYRQRVDTGLERVLAFATELHETARLTGEDKTVFDMGAAIREAAVVLQREGYGPTLSLPGQLPPIQGGRSRFVLALINLLRNAYQAAPADSADVNVTVEVAAGRLRITVDDNGSGVASDDRDKIFTEGFTTHPGGSGQGLTLARATIEDDMGGTLTCEDGSALGGARFVITLPPHTGRAA